MLDKVFKEALKVRETQYWKDVLRAISDYRGVAQRECETVDGLPSVYRSQGKAEAVDVVVMLLDRVLDQYRQKLEGKE